MGYFSSKESMHLSAIMTQDFDMLEMSGITVLDKLYRVVIGTMVAFLFLIFINASLNTQLFWYSIILLTSNKIFLNKQLEASKMVSSCQLSTTK